jgi:TRAP-type mannitol/chloroaromatic compound transport system permease large subunit
MMSNAALGLTMLGMIVVVIMMGFPTAFTLMGLGMMFGFYAFYDPSVPFFSNKIFSSSSNLYIDLVLYFSTLSILPKELIKS